MLVDAEPNGRIGSLQGGQTEMAKDKNILRKNERAPKPRSDSRTSRQEKVRQSRRESERAKTE